MVVRWSIDGFTYCPIKKSDGAFVCHSDYAALEAELSDWKNGWSNSVRAHAAALSRIAALEAKLAERVKVKPLDNDYPISEVASWLTNQATRDYAGPEVDALKLAARILSAIEVTPPAQGYSQEAPNYNPADQVIAVSQPAPKVTDKDWLTVKQGGIQDMLAALTAAQEEG